MSTELDRWSSGTGKVIAVDDIVRQGQKKARYRVNKIVQCDNGNVEVHVYGGTDKKQSARVFGINQVTRCLDGEDPFEATREQLHIVSQKSKQGRRR